MRHLMLFVLVGLLCHLGFVSCYSANSSEGGDTDGDTDTDGDMDMDMDTDSDSDTDTDTDGDTETDSYGSCPDGSWDQFDNSDSPYYGGEQTVRVEVSTATDFHSPWCMNFNIELDGIFANPVYANHVKLFYHHHPLYSHPEAWDIHYAAYAVSKQSMEKFWELHDMIYVRELNEDRMTLDEVIEYSDGVLKVNMEQFNEDRTSQEAIDFIEYEREQAADQGLTGTPSVWVCGQKIDSWTNLQEVVDGYLGI